MNELKLKVGVVCDSFEEWKLFTSSNILEVSIIRSCEAIESDMTRYYRLPRSETFNGVRLDQIIFINLSEEESQNWLDEVGDCLLCTSRVPYEFRHIYLNL